MMTILHHRSFLEMKKFAAIVYIYALLLLSQRSAAEEKITVVDELTDETMLPTIASHKACS